MSSEPSARPARRGEPAPADRGDDDRAEMERAEAGRAEAEREARAHLAACRARVDGFVRARFGPRGTLRLHRAALGPDLLRAPVNVLLAPVHVVVSLLALGADRLRLRALSRWLRERRILLTTDTGRAVEALLVTELLALAPPDGPGPAADDALARTLLSMPGLQALASRAGDPAARAALGRELARSVRDYAGTRGAVAEATVALATLCAGAVIFGALTPGVLSMAPSVAGALSHDAAVSRFAFGEALGGLWYGAFPANVPAWLHAATIAALVLSGAVFAAFAGVLADPLQVRLGIHRRRLHRLLDALEADAVGALSTGFPAREHYYARLFDVVDAGVGVLRLFRG